jgi:hypothetical protein
VHTSATVHGTNGSEAGPAVFTNNQEVNQDDIEPAGTNASTLSDPVNSSKNARSDDGMDVEALTNSLESSLQFVPRGVKKKPAK